MSLTNQQIRSYEPIQGAPVTFGAAAQAFSWEVTLSADTNLMSFGVSRLVTTVPANDPILPAWLTNIRMVLNGTNEIVPAMTRADYVNVVQNIESQEADLISNGNKLYKKFDPPLPKGTRVQVFITVNTLALSFTTPAASAVGQLSLSLYDSPKPASGKVCTWYQPIPQFPAVAGVTAATAVQQDLGTEVKKVRFIDIIEQTVAAASDTFSGLFELLSDGNTVARVDATEMKKQYELISDGLAVPAGHYLLKMPGQGWNAQANTTLHFRATPHTTLATGNYRGYQIIEKPYV